LGGFGLFAPESELADRIGKRRRALRREMAFMLDRVAFAVMAYGTFQKTLAQMLRGEQEKAGPQSTETPGAQTRAGAALGADLVGMGGGLFAEYLNRMAMLLSAGTGGGFEQVRISLDRYYPSFSELTTFLDIVEAGLHGSPMAERLFELGDDMVDELSQEQREAGQRATLVVTAAAGAILVPLLMIVGGPAFNLVLQVFRP
jgi:hypothetical protein